MLLELVNRNSGGAYVCTFRTETEVLHKVEPVVRSVLDVDVPHSKSAEVDRHLIVEQANIDEVVSLKPVAHGNPHCAL